MKTIGRAYFYLFVSYLFFFFSPIEFNKKNKYCISYGLDQETFLGSVSNTTKSALTHNLCLDLGPSIHNPTQMFLNKILVCTYV